MKTEYRARQAVSGRTEQNRVMLGRFGWKAVTPTLFDQSDGAMAG